MSKFLTTLAVGTVLGSASIANADDIFLALPEQNIGNSQFMVDAARSSFEAVNPSEQLSVIRITDGHAIISFTVPDKGRYRIAEYKTKEFAHELSALQAYVRKATDMPAVGLSELRSDIPSTLQAVGDMRASDNRPAKLLIVGAGLQITPNNPSTSMYAKGRALVPSDTLLTGSLLTSPYGLGDRADYLTGLDVSFCAILPKALSAHEKQEIGRMWGHYIALRGGRLVTFTSDVLLCVEQFKSAKHEPLKLRPLDYSIEPAMIAADMSGQIKRITASEVEKHREELKKLRKERDRARKDAEDAQRILDSGGDLDGVTTFTRFTTIPHPTYSVISVTTGVQYERDAFPQFKTSWCYFNKKNNQGAIVRVNVGGRDYKRSIDWYSAQYKVLSQIGLGQANFKAARQSCRFPD